MGRWGWGAPGWPRLGQEEEEEGEEAPVDGFVLGVLSGCVWQLGEMLLPFPHGAVAGRSRWPGAGAQERLPGTAPGQSWAYPQGFHCSRVHKGTKSLPFQVPG